MKKFISIVKMFCKIKCGAFFTAVVCALLAGCAIGTPRDLVRGSSYQPENVYAATNALPANVRRVVVLPLVCDENNYDLTEGRAALEPVMRDELIKTKKFEIVSSDSDFLQNRTGRADWASDETLPPELFNLLRDNSGCDAVLLCRLTVFRAYPPLAVGWRVRLVDAQTGRTIWAADEVFDAGQPKVDNGARRHQLTQERGPNGAPDEWFIQNSPSKFGQYAAARLLATLPAR
jgi:hypothetical protein